MLPARPRPASVDCRPLPFFEEADLAAAQRAFRDAAPIHLGQSWLPEPEPGFAPGVVRTGWRGDTLYVLARLFDTDIVTRARDHNERFWELGDTFEIFLQPLPGDSYVELHVTPNNLRLQLGFDAPPVPATDPDPFEAALLGSEVFRSWTFVDEGARVWHALAAVPSASVGGPAPLAGSNWRFSFGRYDAGRGRDPIISSSSAHAAPRFHRPHEWGELCVRP